MEKKMIKWCLVTTFVKYIYSFNFIFLSQYLFWYIQIEFRKSSLLVITYKYLKFAE